MGIAYREKPQMAHDLADRRNGPRPLEITVHQEGPEMVLAASGEVDMSTVPNLNACLDAVRADSTAPVIVDLAEVTFLDSSGLAAIAVAHRELSVAGRVLAIRNPTPTVLRVLSMTGMDELLCEGGTTVADL